MFHNEIIQQVALKILFGNAQDSATAQQEWEQNGYQYVADTLASSPIESTSPNSYWHQKCLNTITPYNVRPISVWDKQVYASIRSRLGTPPRSPAAIRTWIARTIFASNLRTDIICLQESEYLNQYIFPSNYAVVFAPNTHQRTGIAWNRNRFEEVEVIGSVANKAFAVKLRDRVNNKVILVASGHFTGCNPYRTEQNPHTGALDSARGDAELQNVVDMFNTHSVDLTLLGMDSNVTSLHPRLRILKDAGFELDYTNYLEQTCTNPYYVLNTRIDWIMIKSPSQTATITNLPIPNIGLNNIADNFSDHKPIAASVSY